MRTTLGLCGFVMFSVLLLGQDTDQARNYVPKQSDRPQRLAGEEPGFVDLFDGRTLEGWEGDPRYWRVENGAIVGEVTPELLLRSNTFLVWRGGQPGDFELKLEYRISDGGNSGINYRSQLVPDRVTPENRFALRGYQCDLDAANAYTGNNYEEKGRLFLAVRGQLTRVTGEQPPLVLASLRDDPEPTGIAGDGWNEAHIVARGSVLIHSINQQVTTVVLDDDRNPVPARGLLGVQVHVGPPMKVEYRRIRLRVLE